MFPSAGRLGAVVWEGWVGAGGEWWRAARLESLGRALAGRASLPPMPAMLLSVAMETAPCSGWCRS